MRSAIGIPVIYGGEDVNEIYVSTPLEVCQERDPKGLYARARQNPRLELTGVSAPNQAPLQAEC